MEVPAAESGELIESFDISGRTLGKFSRSSKLPLGSGFGELCSFTAIRLLVCCQYATACEEAVTMVSVEEASVSQ